VTLGLALRTASRRRDGRLYGDLASALYLAGGLLFRFGWVYAGHGSARDDAAVVALAREGEAAHGVPSVARKPVRVPGRRAWAETVRRVSLGVERVVRRGS
jgi:hypothetical protein